MFVISFTKIHSQSTNGRLLNKTDVFGTRVFIENKGQFDHILKNNDKVEYALENGLEKIYFTKSGPVYRITEYEAFTEEQREAIEHGKHFDGQKSKTCEVKMNWLNANQNPVIEESEKQSHYFTYGTREYNSSSFKKITYKNVYPFIDFEYTIPEDKAYGIKYNVILHPGANLTHIKMAYSGDIEKIKKLKNGDVVIKTSLEDVVEHFPTTYYKSGQTLKSAFEIKDNVIEFIFPEGYDNSKEIIIDPWVTAIVSLGSNNYGYDVDYDFSANTYVYGGYSPFKVALYNSVGVLQWVFAGTVPAATPAWSSAPIVSQASNFGINRNTGKTYIGQGYVNVGNRVIRLDASGNYDNFINNSNNQFQEVWDMGFHCTTNEVFVLGGGTSSNISAVTINPTTAVLTLSTFQPTISSAAQDVVSHAIDDQGNIFVNYAGGQVTNKICRVNATFNGNLWTILSGFTVFTEQGNKNQYQGAGSLSSNGFNCLAVNANYLFYYDGLNLAAYNKTTGAQTASTTVPLTLKRQGGIAVDDCNNVYLGGNGSILSYNYNGTAFTALTSIPLTVTTLSNQYVYDIKMDKQSKLLYVCGSGFVANYPAINSLACATASSACFNGQPTAQGVCAGTQVTVTIANSTNLTNPSYSIQPGGNTNNTGTFVLTPLSTIVYTTYVTGANAGSVIVTHSSVANVTVFPQPSSVPTLTQSTCTSSLNGFNLNLAFTPPSTLSPAYNIAWSTLPIGVFSPTQTSVSGAIAPGSYTATIVAANSCSTIAVFSIDPPPAPANFVITPNGNQFVVNCYNPTVSINYLPATLNYTTTNGPSTPQLGDNPQFSSINAFGTWTALAVHPVSGCISSQTYMVTQNTVQPISTLSPTFQNITCSVTSIQMVTATANPGVNIEHQWLSPLGGSLSLTGATSSLLPGGPGTYTHCVINLANGCSTCKNFTVSSTAGFPTFSVVSPQNFTIGCNAKATATINIINGATTPSPGGPISYTLIGPPTLSTIVSGTLSGQNSYSVNVPGTWTVITLDNTNLCQTRVQVSVISNTFGPKLDTLLIPTKLLDCNVTSVTLQAQSSTPNTGYNWAFPGTPGNLPSNAITVTNLPSNPTTTLVGNYTLTLTDNNNTCITTTIVSINQNLYPPKAAANISSPAITCITNSLTLTNSSSSGIPNNTFPKSQPVIAFSWAGPSPQQPLQVSSTYVGLMPGTYTMVAKDLNNGCIALTYTTVNDFREYPDLNRANITPIYTLDCGMTSRTITADFIPSADFNYFWTSQNLVTQGTPTNATFLVTEPGTYYLNIRNKLNGCETSGIVEVVDGKLKANFEADREYGFAPVTVNFTNTSTSSLGTGSIATVWSFGNGSTKTVQTTSAITQTTYKLPGIYKVKAYVVKGLCLDTASKYITVELPSLLEIPNVFTPNGDGVNDLFFLKTANLDQIDIKIFNRWGHKVYDLISTKGNIAWDGKDRYGKDVDDGVYSYLLKATGKDGATFEKKGTITLLR